jgi:lysophospholipase L1-like esterase
MNHYTFSAVDSMKITVMGSSVPSGTGATNNQGYIYLYTQQLKQRYAQSKGAGWNVVNMSIGGNSTIDVTGRVDRDLYPQCGRYVIFALSLGNEGIHGSTNQQGVFDQWKNNMLNLITMARAKGLVPVVTNNYTRGDFDLSDYSYVKKMDMLIHEWDVPSVNLLGAIDDGAGRWAAGYQNGTDVSHPNDAGHAELSYAMVPSLYDALRAGKPVPVKATGNYMTFDNTASMDQLVYTPDNIVHPFTVSFDIKTTANGTIASFKQGLVYGYLKIDAATGAIVYQSPNTGAAQIKGTVVVNDGQWHKITLTHFYARGETDLYSDNTLAGKLTEKLVPTVFNLNDSNGPATISCRDLFFYRAGMNADEVAGLNAGKMLKSSLELYAPLNGQAATTAGQLINLAQSTTTLAKVQLPTTGIKVPTQFSTVKVYPNPAQSRLTIEGFNQAKQYECAVYGIDGRMAFKQMIHNGDALNVSALPTSHYVLVLKDKSSIEQVILSFTKN